MIGEAVLETRAPIRTESLRRPYSARRLRPADRSDLRAGAVRTMLPPDRRLPRSRAPSRPAADRRAGRRRCNRHAPRPTASIAARRSDPRCRDRRATLARRAARPKVPPHRTPDTCRPTSAPRLRWRQHRHRREARTCSRAGRRRSTRPKRQFGTARPTRSRGEAWRQAQRAKGRGVAMPASDWAMTKPSHFAQRGAGPGCFVPGCFAPRPPDPSALAAAGRRRPQTRLRVCSGRYYLRLFTYVNTTYTS